jgi:hypothetical protein
MSIIPDRPGQFPKRAGSDFPLGTSACEHGKLPIRFREKDPARRFSHLVKIKSLRFLDALGQRPERAHLA